MKVILVLGCIQGILVLAMFIAMIYEENKRRNN